MSLPSKLTSAFAAILILMSCGCFGGSNQQDDDSEKSKVLYSDNPTAVQPWFENGDAFSPEKWPDEFLAQIATDRLNAMAESLRSLSLQDSPKPIISNQLQISGWRKSQLKALYSSQQLIAVGSEIDKTETANWSTTGGQLLQGRAALGALLEPWSNCPKISAVVEVESVESNETKFECDVIVSIMGEIPEKGSRQASMIWRVGFSSKSADTAVIEKIQIKHYDEVSFLNPSVTLFRDCTKSVFADSKSFQGQFDSSNYQWVWRMGARRLMGWEGISVADVNNDNLDDVYICQGQGLPNRLYLQNEDGSLRDISLESGTALSEPTAAALFADFDNDGDEDLILALRPGLGILVNDGKAKFHFKKLLFSAPNAISLSAADIDSDGDLDVVANCYLPQVRPDADFGAPNSAVDCTNGGGLVVYRNEGQMEFADYTKRAGIQNRRYSTSTRFFDHDGDGDLDMFSTNDFGPVQYWENKGDWFSESKLVPEIHQPGMSRSIHFVNFDGDAKPEIFVSFGTTGTHRRIANSYRQSEDWQKVEPGQMQSLARRELALGIGTSEPTFIPPVSMGNETLSSFAADLNGDGLEDIVSTNGGTTRGGKLDWNGFFWREVIPRLKSGQTIERKEALLGKYIVFSNHFHAEGSYSPNRRNAIWLNTGNRRLVDISAVSGLDSELDARASVYVDWDHDGDWDVIQANGLAPRISFKRNESPAGNYVKFRLRGTDCNANAIGAKVEVYLKGVEQPFVQRLLNRTGMLTQSSKVLIFRLPKDGVIEKVAVAWPNKKRDEFRQIENKKMYLLTEGSSAPRELARKESASAFVPGQPMAVADKFTSSWLWPKLRSPALEVQLKGEDRWQNLLAQNEQLVLMHLCRSNDARHSDNLEQLKGMKSDYRKLAIYCDTSELPENESGVEYARMSAGGQDLFRVFATDMFGDRRRFETPCWVLIDPQNRVVSVYSNQLDLDQLEKDRTNLADITDDGYHPYPYFEHRQISNLLVADYVRLAESYARAGYADQNERYSKLTARQKAIAFCRLAQAQFQLGNYDACRRILDEAVKVDNRCREAYLILAKLETVVALKNKAGFSKEMFDRTRENFNRVLQLDPDNIDARLGLANLAEKDGELDESIAIIDAAIRIHEKQSLLMDNLYKLYWIKGRLYFKQKKFAEAAKAYAAAFDLRPIELELVTDLAMVYAAAGEFQNAKRFFKLAADLAPKQAGYARTLGICYFITGDYADARVYFEKAIALSSRDRKSRMMLSWVLATAPDEAVRDAKKSLELIEPIVRVFGDSSPQVLEVYAASLAENQQMPQAVEAQKRAIKALASATVPKDLLRPEEEMRQRLNIYVEGNPIRMESKSNHPFPRIISADGLNSKSFR